jgi:hypothetical protein
VSARDGRVKPGHDAKGVAGTGTTSPTPSCPDLIRASPATAGSSAGDGRVKPGHDVEEKAFSIPSCPDLIRASTETALPFTGDDRVQLGHDAEREALVALTASQSDVRGEK